MERTERVILEFFSGIGGLHFAVRRADVPHRLACAFDLDDAAVRTYRHNMPGTRVSTQSIISLKSDDLRRFLADCWLLSPPCQPHTRQGLQLGDADSRSSPLTQLINLLEGCEAGLLPDSLLCENVVGFESSATRHRFHAVLVGRGYRVREFWASPVHFGVPNQRTRYFLLASRRGELDAPPPAHLAPLLLDPEALEAACQSGAAVEPPRGAVADDVQRACAPLADYLCEDDGGDSGSCAVSEHVLERYGAAMDVVSRWSRRSTCFTKNYSRYLKGAGSVLAHFADATTAAAPLADKSLGTLRALTPRFFTPREIANLHGFPPEFGFPPTVGRKKQYELLGNSLSVHVLAELLRYLLGEQPPPTHQPPAVEAEHQAAEAAEAGSEGLEAEEEEMQGAGAAVTAARAAEAGMDGVGA